MRKPHKIADAKFRISTLRQDLLMVEKKKERLAREQAEIILKLVATREAILAAKEQDE